MAGFAKIFGDGDDQVLVKRGENGGGDQTLTFFTAVESVGVCSFTTTFDANDTAAEDADLFFDAVDQDLATARQTLIRNKWARPASDAGDESATS